MAHTDQTTAKFSTLTNEQVKRFIESYADRAVDDMDTKCLIQFVYDTIVENLSVQSPSDILACVSSYCDDQTIEEILENVTK